MKKLTTIEMEPINGGFSLGAAVCDLGCLGVGLSYGLINPILGLVAGVGCSIFIESVF